MSAGYDRRSFNEFRVEESEPGAILRKSALITSSQLELMKSKEEQVKDLKALRIKQRSGVMKFIPEQLHKYIDYLQSLRKNPSPKEMSKSLFIGGFFSFVVWANTSPRSSFMYFVVSALALCSSMLTRNMPAVTAAPGMDKKRIVSWSSNSFYTSLAITLLTAFVGVLTSTLLTNWLPLSRLARGKTAMISAIMSCAYFTSFFEVFEKKSENGSRWKRAMEGIISADEEAKLNSKVFSEKQLTEMYDYNYNPQVDDYPRQPKYIDELDPLQEVGVGGSGELDEGESEEGYQKWKIERKESRRPPVTDAPPETPWIGAKAGMYIPKAPEWLNKAYKVNVLKANAWRDVPSKYKKDNAEFEPEEGPFGFRDKRPDWLDMFGTGVWEEKVTASRRAARAFGTYRKTMWKIDKEVKLLPCDE